MNREAIRDFDGSTARLLLVYILLGERVYGMPTQEVMEYAGINSSNHFYTSRKTLIDAGFLHRTQATVTVVPTHDQGTGR